MNTVGFIFFGVPREVKVTETARKMAAAKGWGRTNAELVFSGKMRKFQRGLEGMVT